MYKRNYGIMPRTLGGFIEDALHNGYSRVNEEISSFSAPVNIRETDNSYEMQLAAPGLKKEDFKINIDQNVLHISYEHKEENKEQQDSNKWLRSEFKQKSFKRSFTLNEKIDTGKISAKYTDGLLHVTIAKKEVSAPLVHEISVN